MDISTLDMLCVSFPPRHKSKPKQTKTTVKGPGPFISNRE